MYVLNITTTDLRTNQEESTQTIKTASNMKMKLIINSFLDNENLFVEAFRLVKRLPKIHPISGRIHWEFGSRGFNASACLAEANESL